MKWNELATIWFGQQMPPLPPADLVRQTFEADRQKRERLRFRRDLLEGISGIGMYFFVAYAGWQMKRNVWIFELAAVLILVPVVVYVRERVRSHRQRLSPEAPLLVRLDAEIAELRHQRRLWLNVGSWYIAPLAMSWTLGWAAVLLKNFEEGFLADLLRDPTARAWLIAMIASGIFAFGWAWIRIRNEARRNADARLAQLEPLRRELESIGQI